MFSQGEARRSLSCLSVCQENFLKRETFKNGVESLSLQGENISAVRDVVTKMAYRYQSKVRQWKTEIALLLRSGALTEFKTPA